MRLVIADTGPVNYLLLIGHIEILPALFEAVILPSAVKRELTHQDTPLSVRRWNVDPPKWVEVRHIKAALLMFCWQDLVRAKQKRSY
ncbi:MAG: hypothetical protein JO182_11360 [Acidobacteriaceae bacterium]|nr:hypothetical protein [Acidobacteriaceae bacterium]MBV9305513.1 hypothetical protein [Acidobacteriaceae bacterium]MBV9938408.1 hypothetical protein [Acidobacteriaceae bacterium]